MYDQPTPEDIAAAKRMAEKIRRDPPDIPAAREAADTARRMLEVLQTSQLAKDLTASANVSGMLASMATLAQVVELQQSTAGRVARMVETIVETMAVQVRSNPELMASLALAGQRYVEARAATPDGAPAAPDVDEAWAEIAEQIVDDEDFVELVDQAEQGLSAEDITPGEAGSTVDLDLVMRFVILCVAVKAFLLRAENPDLAALMDDATWAAGFWAVLNDAWSNRKNRGE